VVYKNGAQPTVTFASRGDDATEVVRLETWRTEHLTDYLNEKLRSAPQKPELAAAAAAAAAAAGGDADAEADASGKQNNPKLGTETKSKTKTKTKTKVANAGTVGAKASAPKK
jgi:hypothetical protein